MTASVATPGTTFSPRTEDQWPAVAAGTASPTTTGLTAGFAAIVVAWSAALLGTQGGPGGRR